MGNNNCTCCCAHGNAQPDKQPEHTGFLKEYGRILLSAALLFSGIIMKATGMGFFADDTVMFAWYLAAYLPVGLPVLKEAWESILQKDIFSEFTLMSIATLGAFYIKEYPEGVAVMLFYSLGELFQERAVSKAKRNISALIDVRPETATVIKGNEAVVTSPRHVQTGDIIEVKTGERVPLDGKMLDDNTYACIFRYDLAQASKDYTEYNEKYNEMTQQVLDEMGVTQDDLNDETDEGYALLEEFINKVSERGGAYQKYIKEIEIPDTFNLHLDITKVRGLEADYEWSEADEEKYGTDAGYYKYEGDWDFDIPVTVDDSQTEVLELNDTNDAGIGLRSVIRTPYELTVNELYEDGSASDCFMVALDANGNKLKYNDSTGNCNNFTIHDRDISTVDIYILDYIQYMDELKGPDNYNNNENKPEGQKWSNLLDQYAKYHKTLHFD